MPYIFQCAIGPVQDFIAAARRSRDLWYGSWMLSELSKAAAGCLADRYGFESLVFPAPQERSALQPSSWLNVANKVVAIVDAEPAEVEQEIQAAIKGRLTRLRDDAFDKVRGDFDRRLADRQLDDLVECYCVAARLEQPPAYANTREAAERLLAARKNTRNFGQFTGTSARKSSLDGSHESVVPDAAYPHRGDSENVRSQKNRSLYQRYAARRGERLSGIDLVKRLGMRGDKEEQRFRSTSHMAALPFLVGLDKERPGRSAKLLQDISDRLEQEAVSPEDQDGALLYENRLREWFPDDAQFERVRKDLRGLIQQYAGPRRPGAYYALLLADGDNMGRTIDAQADVESHRRLSDALSRFAGSVGSTVQDCRGVPVYAGGDDILAYLPLHTALRCAGELAENFAQQMKGFKTAEGRSPTLSAGLAMVHHLDPLADALELARQAESTAKTEAGKNALAITVSKRSGVDRTVAGSWKAIKPRLERLIALTRTGAVPKGVPYELRQLSRFLEGDDLATARGLEALRILGRKRQSGTSAFVSEENLREFQEWLTDDRVPTDELASEMIVATVFAAAEELAGVSEPPS